MATVIFDFDSTIISCESLEHILLKKLLTDPEKQLEIRKITKDGILGKISFEESLKKRLEIARPSKKDVVEFGSSAFKWLTKGMEELIGKLLLQKVNVWIVSGGIKESLLALGKRLKIPQERLLGVKLLWKEKGEFLGIDKSCPFCISKTKGAKEFAKSWDFPTVAIGDAMSDYKLYEEGLVEHFIAYTEHFFCPEVVQKASKRADSAQDLEKLLKEIIYG